MSITVSELIGKTLSSVTVNEAKDEILFMTTDGESYKLLHYDDCCECVSIEDISGDLDDLVGAPILIAEENSNRDDLPGATKPSDSFTWTFYKFATVKGYVDIRWLGESNGYYSESVDFVKV